MTADVVAPSTGRVSAVEVEEGMEVEVGTVLAMIELD